MRYFGLFNIYYLRPILFNEIRLKPQTNISKKKLLHHCIINIYVKGEGGLKSTISGRDQPGMTGSRRNFFLNNEYGGMMQDKNFQPT